VGGIDGNSPAHNARRGKVLGVEIEPVHQGPPRRRPVVGPEYTTIGRSREDDLSSRRYGQAGNSPSYRLLTDGLAVKDHRRPEPRPAAPSGYHRRWQGRASARRRGLSFLEFGQKVTPNVSPDRAQLSFGVRHNSTSNLHRSCTGVTSGFIP